MDSEKGDPLDSLLAGLSFFGGAQAIASVFYDMLKFSYENSECTRSLSWSVKKCNDDRDLIPFIQSVRTDHSVHDTLNQLVLDVYVRMNEVSIYTCLHATIRSRSLHNTN